MAKGKAPDPKRRKTSHPHATYFNIEGGKKEAGWKAGELYGCYGHYAGNHKPCTFELTDGAFQCPFCKSGHEAVWRGYVPIWDRDFALRYVLVNEDYFECCEQIPIFSQVIASRGREQKAPIIVRQEAVMTRSLPERDPWNVPVNQLVVCLTLWKNNELTSWFKMSKPNELIYVRKTDKPAQAEKYKKDPLVKLAEAEARAKADDAAEQMRVANDMQRMFKVDETGVSVGKRRT